MTGTTAPGPRGIGYFPRYVRDPQGALTGIRRRYGDVVHLRRGPLSGFMIFHPDEIRHVLEERIDNYGHGRWLKTTIRPIIGDSVFTEDHEPWRRRRAMLDPLFDRAHVARFASMYADEAQATVAAWQTAARRGERVDVRHEMEMLSRTNAGRTLFGDDWRANARAIGDARPVLIEAGGRLLNSPLGMIPLRVPLPFHRRFLATRARYDDAIARLLAKRRDGGAGEDVASWLVAAGMDDAAIRHELTSMFILAKPAAISLTWTLYLLARHPEAGERLREELDEVLGGRPPQLEDLARLRFLHMVIAEALRMYTPGFLQPREALDDDELRGYHVPAGTRIIMCPNVTHRHPDIWEDPDRFDPDRFSAARSAARPPYAYQPFGEPGDRRCLGYAIAKLELPIAVATIAQRFRLGLDPGERPHVAMGMALDFTRPLMLSPEAT